VSGSGNVFLGYNAGNCDPTTKSNKLFIDNSTTSTPLIWGDFATNNIIIYGGFRAIAISSPSDGRWKKNVQPLESSLEKIAHLQGVSYDWKKDEYPDVGMTEGKQIGLVAQEVEKVLPELVSEDKDGYRGISYSKLTAVLVEAVKELKAQNQMQKKVLEKQQADIEELRFLIKKLQS
jgi:Chaperone of endosialidase